MKPIITVLGEQSVYRGILGGYEVASSTEYAPIMASGDAVPFTQNHKKQAIWNEEPDHILAVLKNRHQESDTWCEHDWAQILVASSALCLWSRTSTC